MMKLALMLLTLLPSAKAQFDESAFRHALKVKKELYIKDGTISGGDRNESDFKVSEVRIAANPSGYDRVVIDFGKNSNLPPYFMVETNSTLKKVTITAFGKAQLDFSSQSAIQAAKKTKSIAKLNFIPLVNADRWTWSIETQDPVKAEVFELSHPARIIIDLKK